MLDRRHFYETLNDIMCRHSIYELIQLSHISMQAVAQYEQKIQDEQAARKGKFRGSSPADISRHLSRSSTCSSEHVSPRGHLGAHSHSDSAACQQMQISAGSESPNGLAGSAAHGRSGEHTARERCEDAAATTQALVGEADRERGNPMQALDIGKPSKREGKGDRQLALDKPSHSSPATHNTGAGSEAVRKTSPSQGEIKYGSAAQQHPASCPLETASGSDALPLPAVDETKEVRDSHSAAEATSAIRGPLQRLQAEAQCCCGVELASSNGREPTLSEPGWVTAFREMVSLAVSTPLPQRRASSSLAAAEAQGKLPGSCPEEVAQVGPGRPELPVSCAASGSEAGPSDAQPCAKRHSSQSDESGFSPVLANGDSPRARNGWLHAPFISALTERRRKRQRADDIVCSTPGPQVCADFVFSDCSGITNK